MGLFSKRRAADPAGLPGGKLNDIIGIMKVLKACGDGLASTTKTIIMTTIKAAPTSFVLIGGSFTVSCY